MDIVNEYIGNTPGIVIPRYGCVDGFSISIQASHGHYCSPRADYAPHYTAVEVGYPSAEEATLLPYIEGDGSAPCDSVYPYVPVEVVVEILERHNSGKAKCPACGNWGAPRTQCNSCGHPIG